MKKLLFLAPFLLFANDNIEKIEFNGLKHISEISAKQISLLQKGDELNLEKVNKTIKNFYKFGYFENISVSFENGILKYNFVEKPAILKIKYNNVSEDLKKILKDKIKRGMIFSDRKLEEIRNFIVSYYDAKGEFNSVVGFEKQKMANGIIITINLNKGEDISIEKMRLYGVKKESVEDIKAEVVNKNRDILGWLPFRYSGDFKLQGLLTDSQSIRDYYLSKGYIDVKVSNPLFVANFDSNKADLEYKIFEGNRYKVGEVGIDIDTDGVIDINSLKEDLHLLKGLYFNIKRVKKDISFLKTKIADEGYAYVQIYPDIKKENGNIVNVTYKIITGKKVYISDVIIDGNTKTLDRVIRRSIYLTPGYLYSFTDKQDSINSLKRTGYFDDVQFKEIRVDDTHIKILVKVKEGLTGSLRAGISYNSYSKVGLSLNVSERNIFGSGHTLGVNVEKSDKTETYSFSLKNPRVLDSEYSLSASIYNNTFEGYSYDSEKKGISLTLGKNLTRHTNLSITYGYENLKLTNIVDDTIIYDKEQSIKSYLRPAISFNNTDDYFFPQHGIQASLSTEYAGIGGDQKFLKTKQSFKYFYSLEDRFDIITILKYKLKTGVIQKNGYLPISEKFYLGGLGTVRGYDYGSISPKDNSNNSIGGKVMMLNSVEVSVPLSIKKKMWLSGFIDNGRIGEDKMNIVRSSYGVSFDWITPVGPLNFTWAWPIGDKKDDDLRRFEFSIGSSF